MQAKVIQIQLNGSATTVDADSSVASVIAEILSAGKRVAVEMNGEIVPKSRHGETRLRDGDKLEVITAVGGG